MLKFKIQALNYAIKEWWYEASAGFYVSFADFKMGYRNRLISLLIENTHIYNEVINAVFDKMSKAELEMRVKMYNKREEMIKNDIN